MIIMVYIRNISTFITLVGELTIFRYCIISLILKNFESHTNFGQNDVGSKMLVCTKCWTTTFLGKKIVDKHLIYFIEQYNNNLHITSLMEETDD